MGFLSLPCKELGKFSAAVMKHLLKWERNRLVTNDPFMTGECITTLGNPGPRTTTTPRCLFPRLLVHRQHQRPPCLSRCLHRPQQHTTPHQSPFRPLLTCSALHLNHRRFPSPTSTGSLPTLPSLPTSPCPPTQSLSTAFPRRPSPSPIPHPDLRRWSAT